MQRWVLSHSFLQACSHLPVPRTSPLLLLLGRGHQAPLPGFVSEGQASICTPMPTDRGQDTHRALCRCLLFLSPHGPDSRLGAFPAAICHPLSKGHEELSCKQLAQ